MSCFSKILNASPEYNSTVSAIERTRLPMGVLGLSHIHKAHLTAALREDTGKRAIVITPDEAQATRLVADLRSLGSDALLYPAKDFVFRSAESCSREYEHKRLSVLGRMLTGEYDIVVCSVEAALQLTLPPEEFNARSITLKVGDDFKLDELKLSMLNAGYVGAQQVDGPGQFSSRGGIFDFFPPDSERPCRCEFWGDTIDSISFFETDTQRRVNNTQSITVTPANEVICGSEKKLVAMLETFRSAVRGKGATKAKELLARDIERIDSGARLASLDKYLPLLYDYPATIFDYADAPLLFVSESFTVGERAAACLKLFGEDMKSLFEEGALCAGLDRFYLTWHELTVHYEGLGVIYLDNLARGTFDTPVRELVTFNSRQHSPWNGSYAVLLDDLRPLTGKDRTLVIMAGAQKGAESLALDLERDGFNCTFYPQLPESFPKGRVSVITGSLSTGFEYPQEKFTLITHGMRNTSATKRVKKARTKNAFNNLEELHRGDYIVHNAHGIGIFDGITKLEASGTVKDYIKIKYDKGDILYVPVTQLDQVSKYIGSRGASDAPVKLNRLGGKEWQKTRSRVRSAVKDMAKELIELYAKRKQIQGYAFSPDIDMQNDFERRFEFEETSDQLRCIDEIKQDMEKPFPMDRILCGDVGFGKTEVALRGVFKCVADGKQCALLVPTTILALQHYQTIKKRFEGFPIEAQMLSRFCSPKQITDTVKSLKRGSTDIVVGTHRLISKDVQFKDLGLIIVDEEQRFGVAQKEKLKEKFPAVDVLTLTATPIPRTLNMAMSGMRDMSVLEEAPQDRYPVQTYVIEHDMDVLVQAMSTELRRAGQVYYLHNRVETIERTASKIKELLPDAHVGIAHGKMGEDELSDVWRGLLEGEIDILVCTTIIETGVDVPNVNTLIIEDADRMGLAQLHQIRGRVGRSARRASAYLTFTRGKQLTEIATNRLDAVREFTEFGSGFKIAMRDLELRGAGNLLGAQQHGHMEAVGYDMYLQLLEQAVSEEKGEAPPRPERECLIDLPIDAHIPPEYIESVPQKIAMYRRIADIRTRDDADDVLDELIDRFGEPPECVQGLITVSLLRGTALKHGVYEINESGGKLRLFIEDLNMEKITALAQKMRGRVMVSAAVKPHISLKLYPGEQRLTILNKAFEILDGNK